MPTCELDRALCGELAVSQAREWLVTNGLGGFAAGTIAGSLTRRYHGLLFAARTPPVGRVLLCPKIDAELGNDGTTYELATDLWRGGAIAPQGYRLLSGFRREGTVPVWTFACADALVERRVWMEPEANRTYVALRVLRARVPVRVTLRAFANHRDLHATTHAGDWTMQVSATPAGIRVVPFDGAAAISLRADRGAFTAEHVWYRNFDYPVERERGLDDSEDHLRVATFEAVVAAGETMTLAVADHELEPIDGTAALERRRARDRELIAAWQSTLGERAANAPQWIAPLVLAADQFIVRRPVADEPDGLSVIAGYPWFADWGRDTAIALPGLALATGRPAVARTILRTLARLVDGGMLPNVFPESGRPAEYNTVDAALWYVHAVQRYILATGDGWILAETYPALRAIVDAYTTGTRFGIAVDPADGLLRAGEPGMQLTWMDAKVGDRVVTPRIGKPIEVNALWIAALRACEGFARTLRHDPLAFASAARRAEASFERFWNPQLGWCYDVLDGPDGHDTSLRPNQIFAVSLPIDVLDERRRRSSTSARRACGRRPGCARSIRATRATPAGTGAISARATAPTTKAPRGRGWRGRSCRPTGACTATLRRARRSWPNARAV
jgi:predicted glycogen debranching enzyme